MKSHCEEIAHGERYEFGKNWARFLSLLSEDRIIAAEHSLCERLGVLDLDGMTFLDIGSGSGLFSLAARRLGARVHSFDFDPHSVACTRQLRARYFTDDPRWTIEEASALDADYLESLGPFDVVYSWGVLHHTGAMWRALENAHRPVAEGGQLFLAIYNHLDRWTPLHTKLKRSYVAAPFFGKWAIAMGFIAVQIARGFVADLLRRRNPVSRYRQRARGMSVWYDWFDWIGGYPFETARPEEIFDFFRRRGLAMEHLKTCGEGLGCNEFVFRKGEARRVQSKRNVLHNAA